MNKRGLMLILLGGALSLWPLPSGVLAQPGDPYTLDWWTVDGGGANPTADSGYSLGGAVGQADAAVWQGDGYTLVGGFWSGRIAAHGGHYIYLPLVSRSNQ
jgi:hypothetical protein